MLRYFRNSVPITVPSVIGAIALASMAGFALAIYTFRGNTVELVEAARIEGAGEWTVFHRIVLPLIRPALAALAILVFTFVWNDYFRSSRRCRPC